LEGCVLTTLKLKGGGGEGGKGTVA
jgi:hypothetical protein